MFIHPLTSISLKAFYGDLISSATVKSAQIFTKSVLHFCRILTKSGFLDRFVWKSPVSNFMEIRTVRPALIDVDRRALLASMRTRLKPPVTAQSVPLRLNAYG